MLSAEGCSDPRDNVKVDVAAQWRRLGSNKTGGSAV